MFGRGSVNGMELNELALNEGNFVEELTIAASVDVPVALQLTRRASVGASAGIAFGGSTLLTARRRAPGTASIAVSGATRLTRRLPAIGATSIEVTAGAKAIRRVAPKASIVVTVGAELRLSWKYIRRAELARIMRVRDFRRLQVHADLRHMRVYRDPAAMAAGTDRGEMP